MWTEVILAKRPTFILLWLVVVVTIFVWTIVNYQSQTDQQLKHEILLFHTLVMLLLTLPSGLILYFFVGLVSLTVGKIDGLTEVSLVSLTCAVAGIWQWFVLLPWFLKKLKNNR